MACPRHPTPNMTSSPAPSRTRVFTLYWRPLRKYLPFLLATTLTLPGCRRSPPALFEAVAAETSGITFANTLSQDSVLNIVNYLYYYNGGGVAGGDIHGGRVLRPFFTPKRGGHPGVPNCGPF